ncbi:MAG: phosphate ABC transporter permease subunit PstC [SAR202 cluster bacterium]|jgi:phosphate transport system permease protein|nr:phosphate ABC transporter permease subunit PstC [Chloroflexota bacterium]MQG24403.1 phosphate ABC transporter permease subunit PstC [SAR202 cluster bacterium]GIS29870.1 MAG: phosphate transport system permease protein [Dehalococcoidia bacterium]MEC7920014.1 phosphate ABC transporter permease subunit PstC [Chloroflexota bacterium]MEC9098853.1 phosphate ABC transporter permease subunit PstC [Chloroflexota bacterium]|tara:strand:- start:7260 stop:8165 length:906 start_codon:yes stop_codon:yes gene_type:complete
MQKDSRGIGKRRFEEFFVLYILRFSALISIITTIGIISILGINSVPFFREVGFIEFFTGLEWTPLFIPQNFGVSPLVNGTFLVAFIAAITALVFGLGSAFYLSEYASRKVRKILKPFLEILAGIPTVVYGYFALTFVTPVIQFIFPETIIFNALSAGLVMGIMIIPMVSTLSEDAMNAVPSSLREAAYGLGAKKYQVALKVVFPSAISGIVASFILAISRAIGETMIVSLAAGGKPALTINPLDAIQTMTAYIVTVSQGETPQGSVEYNSIFAVGLLLFFLTLIMNLVGRFIVTKYAQNYE